MSKLDRADLALHTLVYEGGMALGENMDDRVTMVNDLSTDHVPLSVSNPWKVMGKKYNREAHSNPLDPSRTFISSVTRTSFTEHGT